MEQHGPSGQSDLRVSDRAGLAVGLMAGVAMSVFMVALRFTVDSPVPPEVMADWLIGVTPVAVFDFILERLQFAAKPLLFGALIAGQVLVGGGLGLLYARHPRWPLLSQSQPWAQGLLMAAALWLAFMLLVTPVMGGGLFGASLPGGPVSYSVSTLLALAVFGVSLTGLHRMALVRAGGYSDTGRRTFLQRASLVAVLAVVGGSVARALVWGESRVTLSRASRNLGDLPPEVTPNDQFYEVSKNIVDPRVDVASWRLEIAGDVGNPYSLTYDDLLALPWKEEYVTLTCISNPIGGDLISTALWRGVQLKLLLERAQLPASAQRLAFHAADGYVDSFPVEYATRENVLVAYHMNGEPLPDGHGFPARVIIPGLYGMENVKWLTRIEPVPESFRGYWQRRGWADTAHIKTMSRIDLPTDDSVVPLGELSIGGVAFAGDQGVVTVEISLDGGSTWQPAELRRALSPYTWVLWTRAWAPPLPEEYPMWVRATDRTGGVQPATQVGSSYDGATGYHRIVVTVRQGEPGAGLQSG